MKFIFSVGLILISNLVLGQNTEGFVPKFNVSKKTTHKIPRGQEFTFGYLEVQENRNLPNGRTIQIPIYIFKSRNPNPKPDPIIYTVGGPGSTTMPSAQYMNYYKYLDDRDFILVEQRGNFYAKPHLDCPEWSEALYLSNLPDFDESKSESLFSNAVKDCRERLTQKGINLDAYNTNEIAADINDLVEVLKIAEYNLLTISYSTKIAQVLLRDYPERIRSVVMDSPLPLEVNYDEESVVNVLESISKTTRSHSLLFSKNIKVNHNTKTVYYIFNCFIRPSITGNNRTFFTYQLYTYTLTVLSKSSNNITVV